MQWRSFEEFAVFGGSTSNLGLGGDKACDLFVLYVHLSIPGPEARDPNCGIRNGAAHLDRTRTRPQQWLFAEIQALRDSRGIHMCFLLDRYWICLFDLCEFIHDITRAVMLIWFRFVFILIVFVFSLCVVLYFALCFLFFSSISIHYPWKYLFLSEVRDSALRRWIVCIDCIGAVTGRGRRNICSAHISNEWWAVLA